MANKALLSIDDDPQILEIIRNVALDLDYSVETALTAGKFMTAYSRVNPSVVTVDICMPETDGIELLRWLGDVGSTARIIILSGAHPSYAEMAQRLGQAGGCREITILRKPFRIAELRQALIRPGEDFLPQPHAGFPSHNPLH
ncbi:MAG TPA: response regulator [Alphaproteobacteria bacterium]|nr:response regulator [Alphaproteobacteria bacterium]